MGQSSKIRRTVSVKLDLRDRVETTLVETADQYRRAANFVVDVAWADQADEPQTLTRNELHEDTYDKIRTQTDLQASQVQLARDRAIEAMSAVVEHRNRGWNANKPRFTSLFLDFNERSATIKDDHATLATIDGRVQAPFVLPENADTPHHQYLQNPAFETGRSTLTSRNGEWYLNISQSREIESEPTDVDQPGILGVDLGISNLAVSSTGRFWDGGRISHWRDTFRRRRRRFQQCGTRWAHSNIQSLSQRMQGRLNQHLHTTANEIVAEAVEHGCSVIAFEDLTDIYHHVQRWPNIRNWAYRTLINYSTYKAKVKGIEVVEVDPEYTSIRCSTCGYVDTANRVKQDRFKCKDCGYQNHADYNAAKNVGLTYLRQHQTGTDGRAPVGVRLNSGILTQNGYQQVSTTGK